MRSDSWRAVVPVAGDLTGVGHDGGSDWIQTQLRRAHGNGFAQCVCRRDNESEERRLQIRRLPSGRFILARHQQTGQGHCGECFFFRSDPSRCGQSAYVKGVIEEVDDGFRIRLATSLCPRKASDPAPQGGAPDGARRPGATQRAMTPLGLLNFLWELAGVNVWEPQFEVYRAPERVFPRVRSIAANVRSARVKVGDVLVAMSVGGAPRRQLRFFAGKKTRVVIIGEVLGVEATGRIRLAGDDDSLLCLAGDDVVHRDLQRSHQRELGLLGHEGPRLVGLFVTDISYRNLSIRDDYVLAAIVASALMTVEPKSMIPVASSYELAFARYLIEAGRSFRKPLRFDAGEDVIFPDFELTDAGSDLPIEVWGRTDEAYKARREAKTAYLKRQFGSWWREWDAAARGRFPDLPPRRR